MGEKYLSNIINSGNQYSVTTFLVWFLNSVKKHCEKKRRDFHSDPSESLSRCLVYAFFSSSMCSIDSYSWELDIPSSTSSTTDSQTKEVYKS